MRGIDLAQRARLVGIDYAVFLPAAHADDLVTHGELRVARFGDLAHRATAHGLAQGLGLGVALGVVHAAAHVRVQAQEMVAHQHLAVLQGRGVGYDQLEVAGDGFAHWAVV